MLYKNRKNASSRCQKVNSKMQKNKENFFFKTGSEHSAIFAVSVLFLKLVLDKYIIFLLPF